MKNISQILALPILSKYVISDSVNQYRYMQLFSHHVSCDSYCDTALKAFYKLALRDWVIGGKNANIGLGLSIIWAVDIIKHP